MPGVIMPSSFARFQDASGCLSKGELADMLGVRLTLVIDAKKRDRIPDEWLRRLQTIRGINPQWVLTGEGQKYIDRQVCWPVGASGDPPPPELLRGYSSKSLAEELLRRTALYDAALTTAAPLNLSSLATASASGISRPLILGNAGRLNVQKGQHLFLQLGALLIHEKHCDVRLVLAGGGEREQELRDLAVRLGIADRVLFTGFLEDLSPFWKAIDMFVLTSLWEGFGYVLLEAMLAQKPLLAFAVSNIPELIRQGDNGLLFPLPPDAARREETSDALRPMANGVLSLVLSCSRVPVVTRSISFPMASLKSLYNPPIANMPLSSVPVLSTRMSTSEASVASPRAYEPN